MLAYVSDFSSSPGIHLWTPMLISSSTCLLHVVTGLPSFLWTSSWNSAPLFGHHPHLYSKHVRTIVIYFLLPDFPQIILIPACAPIHQFCATHCSYPSSLSSSHSIADLTHVPWTHDTIQTQYTWEQPEICCFCCWWGWLGQEQKKLHRCSHPMSSEPGKERIIERIGSLTWWCIKTECIEKARPSFWSTV